MHIPILCSYFSVVTCAGGYLNTSADYQKNVILCWIALTLYESKEQMTRLNVDVSGVCAKGVFYKKEKWKVVFSDYIRCIFTKEA